MNIESVTNSGLVLPQQAQAAQQIESGRKAKESIANIEQPPPEKSKVQPEELLDQIKTITQDGAYSVRFERGSDTSEMVVKIFDNETQEVVRQIPAEELMNFKANFQDLIGNLVDREA